MANGWQILHPLWEAALGREGGWQLGIALGLQREPELGWGPGWWRGTSVSLCRHLGTSVPQETGLGVLHVGFGVCKRCR